MAGTGAKKVVISCTGDKSVKSVVFKKTRNEKKVVISCTGDKSAKSVVFKKTRNESQNFLACPVFELRVLIMLKRVSYIACATSVHESVILKRTRNRLKHHFGSIEKGTEVFVY